MGDGIESGWLGGWVSELWVWGSGGVIIWVGKIIVLVLTWIKVRDGEG